MSAFTAGMKVRVAGWQQQKARSHNQWTAGYRQFPDVGVIESVAWSHAEERQIITVAFNTRVRLPVRAEDLQLIEEEA